MNDRQYERSNPVLAPPRKVSLALVLLRVLEVLVEQDRDQRFVYLYNELKPVCERKLRRSRFGRDSEV